MVALGVLPAAAEEGVARGTATSETRASSAGLLEQIPLGNSIIDWLPDFRQRGVVNTDEVIVQLARLGMKGDAASVGRYLRRVLRDIAGDASVSEATRDALAGMVAAQTSSALRFVDATEPQPGFLTIEDEGHGDEPLLAAAVQQQLDAIVSEHENAEQLQTVGLTPTRTLLLTGQPGVGKTICARALARKLKMPLYRVDLAAVMSSFLGKTGQNLVDLFATARAKGCVLLLDEFDAIGKRRDDPSDIGELKRIVNVLLVELESWPSTGLAVAATNHPELLDRAIWRRFEKTIEIDLPTDDVRRALLVRELSRLPAPASDVVLKALVLATTGLSGSDVVQMARSCVRRAVLEGTNVDDIAGDEALRRLRMRSIMDHHARKLFCHVAAKHFNMTQRAIGDELGISHVMVGKLLRQNGTTRSAKGGRSR